MIKQAVTFKTIEVFEQLRTCSNIKVRDLAAVIELDASGWSKIKSGKRRFYFDDYAELCSFFSIRLHEPLCENFDYKKYIKDNYFLRGGVNY